MAAAAGGHEVDEDVNRLQFGEGFEDVSFYPNAAVLMALKSMAEAKGKDGLAQSSTE
jgi:hypothetical protein